MKWPAVALACALAACAGPRAVQVSCLPLKPYSAEFEAKAAAELGALPPDAAIGDMIGDYAAMRAADRACISSNP